MVRWIYIYDYTSNILIIKYKKTLVERMKKRCPEEDDDVVSLTPPPLLRWEVRSSVPVLRKAWGASAPARQEEVGGVVDNVARGKMEYRGEKKEKKDVIES